MIEFKSAEKIDEATRSALIDKCQENGWVKRGGFAWQDDPYLEEYPYDFARVGDIEDLRSIFASGNWAIRQGFLYDDLAFVQQVSGGDEWWTLKRVGDEGKAADWLAFESWSFEPSANLNYRGANPKEFVNYVRAMQMATPERCKHLDYMLPDSAPEWHFATATEIDFSGAEKTCRIFSADFEGYELKVYERPSFDGFVMEIFDKGSKCTIERSEGIESAWDAAVNAAERAATFAREGIHAPVSQRDVESLAARAATATLASGAMARTNPSQARDAIGL